MHAEVRMAQDEVIKACAEYLARHGWRVVGTPTVSIERGYYDPREQTGGADSVSVKCLVNGRAHQ